jgi:hypothetical protein
MRFLTQLDLSVIFLHVFLEFLAERYFFHFVFNTLFVAFADIQILEFTERLGNILEE